MVVVALALASLHVTFVSAFAAPAAASRGPLGAEGRRQLLSTALGLLAGAGAANSASAELFQPGSAGGGIRNNPKPDLPTVDKQTLIKKVLGDNLGRLVNLRDQCFETEENGKIAQIGTSIVIVWDPDAPCGAGKSYIHGAGMGDFAPMTAGAGPLKHTYYAATFEDTKVVEEYKKLVGSCAATPTGGADPLSWQVANRPRGGSC